jgi:hypothetical protein
MDGGEKRQTKRPRFLKLQSRDIFGSFRMPINSVPVRQEVTAEVLRVLTNNCFALKMISRAYEKYFQQKVPIGTTLQIKRPWRPTGRKGQGFQPEPIVQTTVPLTISYWRGGDFVYNDTDEALFLDMENMHKNYSRPLALMIATQVEADLLAYMQITIPNFVGTPGTLPTVLDTYNSAQTVLNQLLAPQNDRAIIYNSVFNQNIVKLGSTVFNPQREIGDQYLEGYVGKYAGFKFGIDEQLPTFTVGVYAGTPVVNGAGQAGSSISIRGFNSSSTTLNPGDRITYTGIYKVNPSGIHNVYTNALFQQVVQATVSDSAGVLVPQLYPPMIPAGDFQNCSASPADGIGVQIAGASGATCNTAFAIQSDAYTAAFLKLHKPMNVQCEVLGGEESGTPGIYIRSIRQWESSGPFAGYETERMDIIYGFAAQYADHDSCVIYG